MIISKSHHNEKFTKNRFCGPSAISSITGVSTECAAAWVKKLCNKKVVKGMYNGEMKNALNHFGVDYSYRNINYTKEQTTLFRWLKNADVKKVYLLVVGHHYVVVTGGFVFDNIYGVAPISETKHKKKKVKQIFEIIRNKRYEQDFWPETKEQKIKPKINKEENRKRYILKLLLKKTGSKIEGGKFSNGKEIVFGDGWNYGGSHFVEVFSLNEAIEILKFAEKCEKDCYCLLDS